MKEYIWQFYNEGFGAIFYKRPVEYINKKIKNKRIVKIISVVIKMLYTVVAVLLAGYILYDKLI